MPSCVGWLALVAVEPPAVVGAAVAAVVAAAGCCRRCCAAVAAVAAVAAARLAWSACWVGSGRAAVPEGGAAVGRRRRSPSGSWSASGVFWVGAAAAGGRAPRRCRREPAALCGHQATRQAAEPAALLRRCGRCSSLSCSPRPPRPPRRRRRPVPAMKSTATHVTGAVNRRTHGLGRPRRRSDVRRAAAGRQRQQHHRHHPRRQAPLAGGRRTSAVAVRGVRSARPSRTSAPAARCSTGRRRAWARAVRTVPRGAGRWPASPRRRPTVCRRRGAGLGRRLGTACRRSGSAWPVGLDDGLTVGVAEPCRRRSRRLAAAACRAATAAAAAATGRRRRGGGRGRARRAGVRGRGDVRARSCCRSARRTRRTRRRARSATRRPARSSSTSRTCRRTTTAPSRRPSGGVLTHGSEAGWPLIRQTKPGCRWT